MLLLVPCWFWLTLRLSPPVPCHSDSTGVRSGTKSRLPPAQRSPALPVCDNVLH
ncbi:hypothetical protein GE21DRAFT_1126543 [Neurospora crassa]|nr:hypothetical protein GE21DRAFT_1126543 [Neurospora crassa]